MCAQKLEKWLKDFGPDLYKIPEFLAFTKPNCKEAGDTLVMNSEPFDEQIVSPSKSVDLFKEVLSIDAQLVTETAFVYSITHANTKTAKEAFIDRRLRRVRWSQTDLRESFLIRDIVDITNLGSINTFYQVRFEINYTSKSPDAFGQPQQMILGLQAPLELFEFWMKTLNGLLSIYRAEDPPDGSLIKSAVE